MLAKHRPDFVLDLTIPEAHHDVTTTALRAGIPVISEKPMASTLAEAQDMVRVSEETGVLYMVSQTRRWDANHDRARRTLAAGAIGELTTIHCDFFIGAHFGGFRDEMPSPLVLDMAIHQFDLARFMGGVDPVAVYAKEFNPKGSWYQGDASAVCVFEMTDDVIFTFHGSWCAEGCMTSWNGSWRFIGTKGTLLCERDEKPFGEVVAGEEGFFRTLQPVEILPSTVEKETWHGALREMLGYLRTGKKPQTECHDNIKSWAMVTGAMESARRGERVTC